MTELHHTLLETWRGSRQRNHRAHKGNDGPAVVLTYPVNLKIREYYESPLAFDDRPKNWLNRPEVPDSNEILDVPGMGEDDAPVVRLIANRKTGGWNSRDDYLATHYELLRENAVRPMRETVARVKSSPHATEADFDNTVGLYDKVHVCGITCSARGIAYRITFSIGRIGKQILWEQSQRLKSGTLVVLTPADDMFNKTAIIATVAARPLAALRSNPPELDLFIPNAADMMLDPSQDYVMVEQRSGYFEADRHTLLALAHMAQEPFPMSEHLVHVNRQVPEPAYVRIRPHMDLSTIFQDDAIQAKDINALDIWPELASDLDSSQRQALKRILTKKLAIVQGPPGTGKTFVSVQALKIMLANRRTDDPPIIIACQTNHAVDQMLRHIADFEPDFVRLGGQTKDLEIIKPRTLYEMHQTSERYRVNGSQFGSARKMMRDLEKRIAVLLEPLKPNKTALSTTLLVDLELMTSGQEKSLENGASQWVQSALTDTNEKISPFALWLGKSLVSVPDKPLPEEFAFDFEETDLEFEQLKEAEAENLCRDDEDFESLSGNTYPLADNFTCRKVPGVTHDMVIKALKKSDLWDVDESLRPAVFRYLQVEAKERLRRVLVPLIEEYHLQASRRQIGKWEEDEPLLKSQKIIGMTTTGLSKYRGLLAALQPKIILIEEAAETLEAPVTAACMPSVEHLILVGDHKQLRPHCQVKALEGRPFYLDVSLFERMVKNGIEYDSLQRQRRMVPEIRRVLRPIYQDLISDHPSVSDFDRRPPIPGMGGIHAFFFTHEWPEAHDENMSTFNPAEADMIVGMVEYLYYNGMSTEEITVLTFYNGQRKRILSSLKNKVSLAGCRFKVVTVDSYQGEENKVVLLSLTRSNTQGRMGFLDVENRVCVALSRAQCGFYVFGNGRLLYANRMWRKVIEIFAADSQEPPLIRPNRLDTNFPVHCAKHGRSVEISCAEDWDTIVGGCRASCDEILSCGHRCTLTCHPFPHDAIACLERCGRSLPCGHGACDQPCDSPCACKRCKPKRSGEAESIRKTAATTASIVARERVAPPQQLAMVDHWQTFADGVVPSHSQAQPRGTGSATSAPVVNLMDALDLEEDVTCKSGPKEAQVEEGEEEWLIDIS